MKNTNIKRFGSTAAQLVYVLALNCALFSLIGLVSLSGSSVRDVLVKSGVEMAPVFGVVAAVFAVSAVLCAAAGFAARKINAAA